MGSLCVPKTWRREHNAPPHNKSCTKSVATLSVHWQKAELSLAGICVLLDNESGSLSPPTDWLTAAAVSLWRSGTKGWRWHDLMPWPLLLFIFRKHFLKYSIYAVYTRKIVRNLQNRDILLVDIHGPGWKIYLLYMAAGQKNNGSAHKCDI